MASDVGHDPRSKSCKNVYPPRRARWGDSSDETMRVVVVKSTCSCFMKAFPLLSILEHIEIARTSIAQGQEGSAFLVETY